MKNKKLKYANQNYKKHSLSLYFPFQWRQEQRNLNIKQLFILYFITSCFFTPPLALSLSLYLSLSFSLLFYLMAFFFFFVDILRKRVNNIVLTIGHFLVFDGEFLAFSEPE